MKCFWKMNGKVPEKLVKGNRVGFALAWRIYLDGHPAVRCFMPGTSG
jgi:hypothetical protein